MITKNNTALKNGLVQQVLGKYKSLAIQYQLENIPYNTSVLFDQMQAELITSIQKYGFYTDNTPNLIALSKLIGNTKENMEQQNVVSTETEEIKRIFNLRKQWGDILKAKGLTDDEMCDLWNLTLEIFREPAQPNPKVKPQ